MSLKQPIIRDQKYMDFLKTQRCIISGQYGNDNEGVDAAHVGKLGLGIKNSDEFTLPILHRFHLEQDRLGEASAWRKYCPDDVLLAALRALARERYREYLAKK